MTNLPKTERAMRVLESNGLMPYDLEEKLLMINFKANEYSYWGHKYAEGEENYQNTVVAMQFKYRHIENPFWIVLFKGAQYRDSDVAFAAAFWKLPDLSDAVYETQGVSKDDNTKGADIVREIAQKFQYLWFEQKSVDEEPVIWNDPDMLSWLANEFLNILNIQINISVPEKKVNETHVIMLEDALHRAKESLAKQSKHIGVGQFKELLEKADAITIDGGPLLTNFKCDEDMLIDTQWSEDDLLFECHYNIEDVKSIRYNPNTKQYELSINGGETCKFELFNLSKVEAA